MDFREKELFRSSIINRRDRKASGVHVIICPFCENGQPIPTDFDSIHRCSCGACFKVCGTDTLEIGVGDIATTLWDEDEMSLVRTVPVDFCNIVIEKDFDRLLNIRHTSPDICGVERFCKYDSSLALSLVWVKRLF